MNSQNKRSTLRFTSNLLPRRGDIATDTAFLSGIRDPRLLKQLRLNGLPLTPLQREEYKQAGSSCQMAGPADYPWGTVRNADGNLQVVCRCTRTSCRFFFSCRPDFSQKELDREKGAKTVLFTASAAAEGSGRAEEMPDWSDLGGLMKSETFGRWTDFAHADPDLAILIRPASTQPSEAAEMDFGELSAYYAFAPIEESALRRWEQDIQDLLWPDPSKRLTESEFQRRITAQQWAASAEPPDLRNDTQQDVIRLDPVCRAIVSGGPGTGKTWTLIERLIYLVENRGLNPGYIEVLTFSNAAKNVVKGRLAAAASEGRLGSGWKDIDVRTFHSYSWHLNRHVEREWPELLPLQNWRRAEKAASYASTIRTASLILRKHPEVVEDLQHLLVDEMQDLTDGRADLLKDFAGALPPQAGFTFFGDPCQSIFPSKREPNSTSPQIYQMFGTDQKGIIRPELIGNHRTDLALANVADAFREAVAGLHPDRIREAAGRARQIIPVWPVPWQDMSPDTFRTHAGPGSIGILSYHNHESAAVSEKLWDAGVRHDLVLDHPKDDTIDGWLGRTLAASGSATLSCEEFAGQFLDLYPSGDPFLFWNTLTENLGTAAGGRVEIRDLLRSAHETREALSTCTPAPPEADAVTVTTVHKAKGLEFDTVLMADSLLNMELVRGGRTRSDEAPDDVVCSNARVAYVAMTRPKKRLFQLPIPAAARRMARQPSDTLPGGTRGYVLRTALSSRKNTARTIRSIQFASERDLASTSFADCPAAQEYLLGCAGHISEISLELRRETGPGELPVYRLVDPDQPGITLARTTAGFARDLDAVLRGRGSIDPVFPEKFLGLTAAGTKTHICPEAPGLLPGAHHYGDTAWWLGLEIASFAEASVDMY